jgi:hypothetical protein
MQTLKEYKKTFSEATKKLVFLTKDYYESDILELAVALNMSVSTVRSYRTGKGTNLETTLTIIEAVEKRNNNGK